MRASTLLPLFASLMTVSAPALAREGNHHDGPPGVPYRCGDQVARIAFNGQGYLPGLRMQTAHGAVPRSQAHLRWAGHDYPMIADEMYLGSRYVSAEPAEGGGRIAFTLEGDEGRLLRVATDGGEGELIAACVRARTIDELAGEIVGGHSEGESQGH